MGCGTCDVAARWLATGGQARLLCSCSDGERIAMRLCEPFPLCVRALRLFSYGLSLGSTIVVRVYKKIGSTIVSIQIRPGLSAKYHGSRSTQSQIARSDPTRIDMRVARRSIRHFRTSRHHTPGHHRQDLKRHRRRDPSAKAHIFVPTWEVGAQLPSRTSVACVWPTEWWILFKPIDQLSLAWLR